MSLTEQLNGLDIVRPDRDSVTKFEPYFIVPESLMTALKTALSAVSPTEEPLWLTQLIAGLPESTHGTIRGYVDSMQIALRSQIEITNTERTDKERLERELSSARLVALEEAAKIAEGGRFLHDDAPDARFGKACATAIRRALKNAGGKAT